MMKRRKTTINQEYLLNQIGLKQKSYCGRVGAAR